MKKSNILWIIFSGFLVLGCGFVFGYIFNDVTDEKESGYRMELVQEEQEADGDIEEVDTTGVKSDLESMGYAVEAVGGNKLTFESKYNYNVFRNGKEVCQLILREDSDGNIFEAVILGNISEDLLTVFSLSTKIEINKNELQSLEGEMMNESSASESQYIKLEKGDANISVNLYGDFIIVDAELES